jgi:hypothetical protein
VPAGLGHPATGFRAGQTALFVPLRGHFASQTTIPAPTIGSQSAKKSTIFLLPFWHLSRYIPFAPVES